MKDKLITGSIDCTKIDKSKLHKGKYLNFAIFLSEETDKYGNHGAVIESQTKEERESGANKNYLGNVKRWDK